MSAVLGGIGVIGDSDSDEYVFADKGRQTAENYVELLAETRKLDFGEFSAAGRAAPRNEGYANNWAESGATSTDMIADGQVKGMASQAEAGKISVGIVYIGSNDLSKAMRSRNPAHFLSEAVKTVMSNINTAVRRLRKARPTLKIIVATVIDVSLLPHTQDAVKNGDVSEDALEQVREATADLNEQIMKLPAHDSRIAVADVAGEVQKMVASPTLTLGPAKISTDKTGDDPNYLFLADGLHLGTAAQGLVANSFIRTLASAFGFKIKPLTIGQILSKAKLGK